MNERIPAFEGHPVDATVIKMSGAAPLEDLEGAVIGMDDMVQLISHYRCVGVQHKVDDNTGKVIRVQVLRPILMSLVPFDPEDPNDRGIMRAMPRQIEGSVTKSEPSGE